jgi:hydrogenase maturation protease
MVAGLGGQVGRVFVVGCEPAVVSEHLGLSDEVARAVDEAAKIVMELVAELSTPTSKGGIS